MTYFDYENVARQTGISSDKLEELRRNDMMYELHLLRVCLAIRDSRLSLDEALRFKSNQRAA